MGGRGGRQLAVVVAAATALRRRQHDLRASGAQRDRVIVDRLDGVAVELGADLGQDMGRAAAVEQQRLVALGHDADDAQRDSSVRYLGGWRGRLGSRLGGRGLLGARERSEQGQGEDTGDEAHGATAVQAMIPPRRRVPAGNRVKLHRLTPVL